MYLEPACILVADPDKKVHELFNEIALQHKNIKILHAHSSDEATLLFSKNSIDLAFIDLHLAPIHGLEVLKKLKVILPQTDVVITSYEPMVQNFRVCLDHGALDFIAKPLKLETILHVLNTRKHIPYQPHIFETPALNPNPFILKKPASDIYLKFWGTRGSHSVSGSEYIRFGGNTSCLEVRHGHHIAIIDAGSGLCNLGTALTEHGSLKHIELLLGHTHLDHMAGLTSFGPIHDPKFSVTIRAPINFYKSTEELLRDMFTHAFFPVELDEIKASLKFKELHTFSPFDIGPINIDCHYTYHPGTTLGFKIRIGQLNIGYVTDNEALMGYTGDPKLITFDHPLLEPHLSFIEFFKNCDVLVHEAQYTAEVYPHKVGWGHSSIYNTAVLVKYINPKVWIVTHHDPEDTDERLQKKFELLCEACNYLDIQCGVRMAFDGLKINC